MNPDVVFLGQRGFAPEIDFDGRIRRCQILAWTTVDWGTALPCLAVNVEPAISLGGYTLTVGVLVPSEIGTLDDLKEGLAVDVDVCILQDPATLAVAPIALDKIMPFSNGVIAISEDALPLAPEQEFQRMIVLLRTYVEEHGNTDVPPNWRSDGARLGEWLSHLRLVRRTELKGHNVQVDPRWVRALEAIPGWHWQRLGLPVKQADPLVDLSCRQPRFTRNVPPHPIFSELGGILPWGVTRNSDTCCSLAAPLDVPDDWPVPALLRATAIHSLGISRQLLGWRDRPNEIASLGRLTELRQLVLRECFAGESVAPLCSMSALEALDCDATSGWPRLAQITGLQRLRAYRPRIKGPAGSF